MAAEIRLTADPTSTAAAQRFSDASHALPVLQEEDGHLRESGRGLHLVDALATAWGVIPHAAGKTVWFELA